MPHSKYKFCPTSIICAWSFEDQRVGQLRKDPSSLKDKKKLKNSSYLSSVSKYEKWKRWFES